jgi:hypothetical protein
MLKTLCVAASFGIGGAIGATTAGGPMIFIFPIMGAVGGASIGLLLGKRARAILMALAGAVGFGIGSLPVLLFAGLGIGSTEKGQVIPLIGIIGGTVFLFILGAIQGLLGGASLGLGLRNRVRAGYLMAGGTIGFGIGAQVAWGFVFGLANVVVYAIWGAIGGAALGVALVYLEKRRAETQG